MVRFSRCRRLEVGTLPDLKPLLRIALNNWSVAAVIAASVLVFALIWFVPILIVPETTSDAAGNTIALVGVARSELENEHRKTFAQIALGLVVLFGAYVTWRRTTAAERNVQVIQEGQITERFTRAIEQLGSDNIAVCLGGIYALERIAKDSTKDRWQVMEVLTAYVRDKAQWVEPTDAAIGANQTVDQSRRPPTTIQAILTVIGRLEFDRERGEQRLDLQGTDLRGADLVDASLNRALLMGVHLEGAKLFGARLQEAWLHGANLELAWLDEADLRQVRLHGANLQQTMLSGAHLERAWLGAAQLDGANLFGATGLTKGHMRDAHWDENTIFPEGFEPPPMRED